MFIASVVFSGFKANRCLVGRGVVFFIRLGGRWGDFLDMVIGDR